MNLKGLNSSISVAIFLFVSLVCHSALAQNAVSVAPVPDWVTPLEADLEAPTPDSIGDGEFYLLHDRQLKTGPDGESWYFHSAVRIANEAGMERNSTLTINYDPSYERLTYHRVRVIRDGEVIDHLDLSQFKDIQREQELEYAIYDGRRTSVYLFSDLRVGDVVETSFTRHGRNPALDSLHNSTFSLQYSVPVAQDHIRVVSGFPDLYYRMDPGSEVPVKRQQTPWGTAFSVYQKYIAPVSYDNETPPWYSSFGQIQFSNSTDWQQVAAWGAGVYEPFLTPDPDIVRLAEDLTAGLTSEQEKATALLRFVQSQIRYMGIELGSSSFIPHAADTILARRFGDCKDKTVVLISLLRAVGIEAVPMLVNTARRQAITHVLPGATQFDHVITQVMLKGKTYWVDPTLSLEKGPINSDEVARYQYGLVLTDTTERLAPISSDKLTRPDTLVEEHFVVRGDGAEPTDFTVTTTFRRSEANRYRARIARTSEAKIQAGNLNYYTHYYPSIEVSEEMVIEDNADLNEIVVKEHYRIREHWDLNAAGTEYDIPFYTTEIESYLTKPDKVVRRSPYYLVHPVYIRQKTIIDLPATWNVPAQADSLQNKWFSFRNNRQYADRQIIKEVDFKSRTDHVAAGEIQDYLDQLKKVDDSLGVYLTSSLESYDPEVPADSTDAYWFIYLGLMTLLLIFALADPTRKRSASLDTNAVFYPVSVGKFVALNLFTLGLYQLYWMYRNYQYLRAHENDNVMPLARAIFFVLFFYSFHQRLRDFESAGGQRLPLSKGVIVLLAMVYLATNLISSVHSLGFIISLFSFVCLLPALQFINQLNGEHQEQYNRNSEIRASHVAMALVGGQILLFSLLSTANFFPSNLVVRGDDLWQKEIRFMQRLGVMTPEEELRYFYSAAMFSFSEDGNGLTDKRVFSYWKDEQSDTIQKQTAYFEEIAAVSESYARNELEDTVVTITTRSGNEFYLYLSSVDGGDRQFISDLKRSLPAN